MKRFAFTALMGAMVMGSAQAAQDNVGCGVGSMVFDGQSGVAPQVLAATTNGISGNQTFGITSGTLGCTQDGVVRDHTKLSMFTGANMESIASNMAVGEGEALETMAELMGIEDADKAAFYTASKQNFDRIFPSAQVTAEEVLSAVDEVMAADATLAKYAA